MNLHVHANFGPCAPLSSHTPCYLASPPVLLQLKLLACTGRDESDSAAFATQCAVYGLQLLPRELHRTRAPKR